MAATKVAKRIFADGREYMDMKLTHAIKATMTSRVPASALLTAMVTLATPAAAQTYDPKYPVCLQIYQSMVDYYFECVYTSIPQCQASASGRNASCVVNPYYGGPKAKRSKKQPRPY